MNLEKKAKTILVVDDDPVHIKLLDYTLNKQGYNVLTAVEAANGLQMAIEDDPDLIILDVMMPIINGYNFCRLLKSEEKQKGIPIVFLTSRNEKDDIAIGQEMGAEAYLTKPVNINELLKIINKLLN